MFERDAKALNGLCSSQVLLLSCFSRMLCFGALFLQVSLSRGAVCTALHQDNHGYVLQSRPFQQFTRLDVNLG